MVRTLRLTVFMLVGTWVGYGINSGVRDGDPWSAGLAGAVVGSVYGLAIELLWRVVCAQSGRLRRLWLRVRLSWAGMVAVALFAASLVWRYFSRPAGRGPVSVGWPKLPGNSTSSPHASPATPAGHSPVARRLRRLRS